MPVCGSSLGGTSRCIVVVKRGVQVWADLSQSQAIKSRMLK